MIFKRQRRETPAILMLIILFNQSVSGQLLALPPLPNARNHFRTETVRKCCQPGESF
jgi:hypothetical protein